MAASSESRQAHVGCQMESTRLRLHRQIPSVPAHHQPRSRNFRLHCSGQHSGHPNQGLRMIAKDSLGDTHALAHGHGFCDVVWVLHRNTFRGNSEEETTRIERVADLAEHVEEHCWTSPRTASCSSRSALQRLDEFPIIATGEAFFNVESGRWAPLHAPPTQHYTIVFNAFALMTLVNAFNCRKLRGERDVLAVRRLERKHSAGPRPRLKSFLLSSLDRASWRALPPCSVRGFIVQHDGAQPSAVAVVPGPRCRRSTLVPGLPVPTSKSP